MSEPHDPERCTPCRGTGRVISGLGGEPKPVTCPWCGYLDHDAELEAFSFSDVTVEMECGRCEKRFKATRDVSVTFTTERIDS